jgi:hypothetical protein
MTTAEQEALDWLRVVGSPTRGDTAKMNDTFQRLCGMGLARCRFIHGEFYYEAKVTA